MTEAELVQTLAKRLSRVVEVYAYAKQAELIEAYGAMDTIVFYSIDLEGAPEGTFIYLKISKDGSMLCSHCKAAGLSAPELDELYDFILKLAADHPGLIGWEDFEVAIGQATPEQIDQARIAWLTFTKQLEAGTFVL